MTGAPRNNTVHYDPGTAGWPEAFCAPNFVEAAQAEMCQFFYSGVVDCPFLPIYGCVICSRYMFLGTLLVDPVVIDLIFRCVWLLHLFVENMTYQLLSEKVCPDLLDQEREKSCIDYIFA